MSFKFCQPSFNNALFESCINMLRQVFSIFYFHIFQVLGLLIFVIRKSKRLHKMSIVKKIKFFEIFVGVIVS